jgi:hypothetical protein
MVLDITVAEHAIIFEALEKELAAAADRAHDDAAMEDRADAIITLMDKLDVE